MKEISRRLKHQSQFSIKEKKCLDCCETLIFTGIDSKSHGWIEHFKCTKCYTLHEFSSNDMGQGSDDLWSVSSWENHKQLTAER